jgi:hypothetical protein
MNYRRHPNFILGLVSFILLFLGVGMRANGYDAGNYVLGGAILLGAIHWIWSIIDVLKDYRVKSAKENNIIWVIAVIILPPVGGLLYYGMNKTQSL